jgi:hypothetical protein
MTCRHLGRVAIPGVALLAAAMLVPVANAQNSVSTGAARSVDLRTAPVLPTPPMPPIFFDRPTPQWAADRMRRMPPDKTGGEGAPAAR